MTEPQATHIPHIIILPATPQNSEEPAQSTKRLNARLSSQQNIFFMLSSHNHWHGKTMRGDVDFVCLLVGYRPATGQLPPALPGEHGTNIGLMLDTGCQLAI